MRELNLIILIEKMRIYTNILFVPFHGKSSFSFQYKIARKKCFAYAAYILLLPYIFPVSVPQMIDVGSTTKRKNASPKKKNRVRFQVPSLFYHFYSLTRSSFPKPVRCLCESTSFLMGDFIPAPLYFPVTRR